VKEGDEISDVEGFCEMKGDKDGGMEKEAR